MHNFSNTYSAGLSNPIDRNAGRWCWDDEIELVEEAPKNLIPTNRKNVRCRDWGRVLYQRMVKL